MKLIKLNLSNNLPVASTVRQLALTLLVGVLSMASAVADTVIVTCNQAAGVLNNWPPYLEDATFGSFFASTGNSTVGIDPVPAWGTRFGSSGYPAITVKPTLGNPGGVYEVSVTIPTTTAPADVTADISVVGGTLSTNKAVFTAPFNAWNVLCYVTNDVGVVDPEITFTYAETTIFGTNQPGSGFSRRWYPAPLRFKAVDDPCASTPALPPVNGPLAAGQTVVNVAGVGAAATAVTVYANGVQIGQLSTGITEGVNQVTTTALVKGDKIVATQTVAGQEGCTPNAASFGPIVGGGANPMLRVSLILDQDPTLTGPIGASSAGTANEYWVPASGLTGGFATAPAGGIVISPGECWQTVTVNPGFLGDPQLTFRGAPALPDANPYAAFAGIAFCVEDTTDTGPFEIYIDNLVNGNTLIEGFESYTNGQPTVIFGNPSAAGILGGPPLAEPNVSVVTTANADTGTKSLRYYFQLSDSLPTIWQRAVASGSVRPFPVVDLSQPISIRLLVLPVGSTTSKLTLSSAPVSQIAYLGNPRTLSVTANGTPPYSYQWKLDGNDIPGAMASTYNIPSVAQVNAGVYSVQVSDATCTILSPPAVLTVSDTPPPPGRIEIEWASPNVILSWEGTYVLQESPAVNGTYTDVNGASSPYSTAVSPGNARYFRLRTP
ncbi:MAG: hypothetical protein IH623_00090 [Verrucomicrobia bacterium]|nr:hypothetical protein [Verrucomicrobiota bacterium]